MSYSHDRGDARTRQSVEETAEAMSPKCVHGHGELDVEPTCRACIALVERKRIVALVRERARAYAKQDADARERSVTRIAAGRQKRRAGDNHAAAIGRVLALVADKLERGE